MTRYQFTVTHVVYVTAHGETRKEARSKVLKLLEQGKLKFSHNSKVSIGKRTIE